VGIPDTRFTEMVTACIQPRENWQWLEHSTSNEECHLSRKNLQQYCLENNLSRFASKQSLMFVKLNPYSNSF